MLCQPGAVRSCQRRAEESPGRAASHALGAFASGEHAWRLDPDMPSWKTCEFFERAGHPAFRDGGSAKLRAGPGTQQVRHGRVVTKVLIEGDPERTRGAMECGDL